MIVQDRAARLRGRQLPHHRSVGNDVASSAPRPGIVPRWSRIITLPTISTAGTAEQWTACRSRDRQATNRLRRRRSVNPACASVMPCTTLCRLADLGCATVIRKLLGTGASHQLRVRSTSCQCATGADRYCRFGPASRGCRPGHKSPVLHPSLATSVHMHGSSMPLRTRPPVARRPRMPSRSLEQ